MAKVRIRTSAKRFLWEEIVSRPWGTENLIYKGSNRASYFVQKVSYIDGTASRHTRLW